MYPQDVTNLDGHIIWLNIGYMGDSTKMGVPQWLDGL